MGSRSFSAKIHYHPENFKLCHTNKLTNHKSMPSKIFEYVLNVCEQDLSFVCERKRMYIFLFFILTFTALLLLSIPNFWLAVIVHRVATLDTSFFPCFTASTISCTHKQFKRVKPTCTSCITFGNLFRKLNNYWLACNLSKQGAFPMAICALH